MGRRSYDWRNHTPVYRAGSPRFRDVGAPAHFRLSSENEAKAMSNEQLDRLTETCTTCKVRHLDYKREDFVHMWADGLYHPVAYWHETTR